MRSCNKCGEMKSETDFYVDRNLENNRKTICSECDKNRFAKYYRENILAYKKRSRDKYNEDKKASIEAAKKWREENPERYKELQNKYKNEPTFKGEKKVLSLGIKFKKLKCSIKHFVLYIESKMDLDMTWDNYKKVWDIQVPDEVTHYTDYTVRKFS